MTQKKLNLFFGARVKGFAAPPAGLATVLADGHKFDYTPFAADGFKLPSLLARALQLVQSQSENASSRKKTNASINAGITSFLRWCVDSNLTPTEFTPSLLIDFQSHLKLTRKAWTVYGHYTIIARCCSVLMEHKLIARFPIPKNISLEAAKMGSTAGSTIGTSILGEAARLSTDDVNERTLTLLVDAAWDEAFELLDRVDQGTEWRASAKAWRVAHGEATESSPPNRYLTIGSEATRSDCLRVIVQNIELAFGGFSATYPLSNGFKDFADAELTAAVSYAVKIAAKTGEPVIAHEIYSYFHPTKELAGCALFLLSAAQINPESAAALRVDCVQTDSNPNIARIAWFKWRAGGEQASMPFPKGTHRKSKTIPNLLERYKEASVELRLVAPEKISEILLIWGGGGTGKKSVPAMAESGFRAWHAVKGALGGRVATMERADQALRDLVLKLIPQLTLGLVRTTALNVSGKRLNRDVAALALMDGRQSETPLVDHYLRNESTHERWDAEVREAQAAMLDWTTQKPLIFPPDPNIVASNLSVELEAARNIVDDDFNGGMGASLVDGRVIVIDTPINALRMMQWIEKLNQAEQRLVRDNPLRWQWTFQPQRKLFSEALAMVSKKSKSEAMTMSKTIQLPFPEVI